MAQRPGFQGAVSGLASCQTPQSVADLLRDIGTLTELYAWSERLKVARLLMEKRTYREIAAITGASTTTITRVARFLKDGEGGYRRVLSEYYKRQPKRRSTCSRTV